MATISDTTVTSLATLQAVCWQNSEDKGFHANEPSDPAELAIYNGNRLMLIVSEAAEALEEIRSGRSASETYYPKHTAGCARTDHRVYGMPGSDPACDCAAKPEGVPSELADIVIRCFDFAGSNDFDLGKIIQEKLTYNTSRQHMHGKKF